MYSKYMTGTDFSKMPYTDSMQRNPLYSGSPRAAGQQQSPTQGANNAPKSPAKPAIDMTAYRPGVAQPIPPQSQGTPYQPYVNNQGQQFAGTMSFAPGTSDAYRNQAFGNWANSQGDFKQPSQVTGDPRGALAAASPADRPPPFQMGLASTPWGMSADPFVERDALIQRLAAQRMQDQIAFNSGGPVNPVAGMLPWQNVPQAMQEAGLAGGAPSMRPGYGGGFVGAANGGFGQDMGYTLPGRPSVPPSLPPAGAPPASPPPGYGTPPSQRGTARTMDWRDGDGDGVDDRDQGGPGMPRYTDLAAGASSGNAATARLRAKHPNWDSYPEWYKQLQYKQDAWEQGGNAGGSSRAPGSKQPASQVAPEAWIYEGPAMGRAQPIPPPSHGTPYNPDPHGHLAIEKMKQDRAVKWYQVMADWERANPGKNFAISGPKWHEVFGGPAPSPVNQPKAATNPRTDPAKVGVNNAASAKKWAADNQGTQHYYDTAKGRQAWSRLTPGQKMGLV